MVNVTIHTLAKVTNTGNPHDVIVGISLLDPDTREELYMLPWWVWWDVPSDHWVQVGYDATGDIEPGTYDAVCKAWTNYEEGVDGNLVSDGEVVGKIYNGGTGECLPPILDEAHQTLVIGPGAVSATIDEFTINLV